MAEYVDALSSTELASRKFDQKTKSWPERDSFDEVVTEVAQTMKFRFGPDSQLAIRMETQKIKRVR